MSIAESTLEPSQHSAWLFSRELYKLCYTHPIFLSLFSCSLAFLPANPLWIDSKLTFGVELTIRGLKNKNLRKVLCCSSIFKVLLTAWDHFQVKRRGRQTSTTTKAIDVVVIGGVVAAAAAVAPFPS